MLGSPSNNKKKEVCEQSSCSSSNSSSSVSSTNTSVATNEAFNIISDNQMKSPPLLTEKPQNNLNIGEKISGDENTDLQETEAAGDSGFISGQLLSATNIEFDDNFPPKETETVNENLYKDLKKDQTVINPESYNQDSGCIEEDSEEEEEIKQESTSTPLTEEGQMILDKGVDSGITEWFCKISLDDDNVAGTSRQQRVTMNNLGAASCANSARKSSSIKNTATQKSVPPTTFSNAWEKFYRQNDDGDTALHLACISGYVDVTVALIRMAPHPCLFNIQNDAVQTGLHLAALAGQPKILRMLLIAGAESCARDRLGNTPLHVACIAGDLQCVKALTVPISASEINEAQRLFGGHWYKNRTIGSPLNCKELPSDLELRNYNGERCVHIAAYKGHTEVLRHLVNYGVDINAREGKSGRTPLHIAIETCNEILANFLLEECTTLNLETETYAGLTAYQFACILNNSKMQSDLEKHGADPLTPPDSDYDSSDAESEFDDSQMCNRYNDSSYFGNYNTGSPMTVA